MGISDFLKPKKVPAPQPPKVQVPKRDPEKDALPSGFGVVLGALKAKAPKAKAPKAQAPQPPKVQVPKRDPEKDALPSGFGVVLAALEAQAPKAQAPKAQAPKAQRPGKLNSDRLVVLRMGLGRDSMTMLVLLAQNKLVVEGKPRGPDDIDAVVFTDPGHEWQFTYDLIPRVKAFCKKHGIRFLVQEKPPKEGPKGWLQWMQHQIATRERAKRQGRGRVDAFGTPPWREDPPASIEARAASGYYHDRIPLFDDYAAKEAWIAKDDSTCTINHKIKPNRELLVDLMEERFGPQAYGKISMDLPYTRAGQSWGNKVRDGLVRPHLMLIGYAADEQKRLVEARKAEKKREGWSKDFDSEAYPLMEMGITKEGETPYLEGLPGVDPDGRYRVGGFSDVKKSGCRSCIHQDAAQWWMLRHLDPDYFQERVEHEKRVVRRTGPWQAIFPKKFVAFNLRKGRENPILDAYRTQGVVLTFARQEVYGYYKNGRPKKRWVRVSRPDEDGPDGERVYAHIWIPVDKVVDAWLSDYRTRFGREPEWEEVARKEYRACAVGAPP